MRLVVAPVALAVLLAAALGGGCGTSESANLSDGAMAGLVSGPVPALAEGGTWINTPPLDLAGLRGRVVFLEFGFLGCQHCTAMIPSLVRWSKEYGPAGLQVLAVNDGRHGPLEGLRTQVKNLKVPYAIYHDESGESVHRFGVRAYPSAFVVDRAGRVVWKGNPRRQEKAVEDAIVAALR